jgi:hypothetical protein
MITKLAFRKMTAGRALLAGVCILFVLPPCPAHAIDPQTGINSDEEGFSTEELEIRRSPLSAPSSSPYYNVKGMLCKKPPMDMTGCQKTDQFYCVHYYDRYGRYIGSDCQPQFSEIHCPMCGEEEDAARMRAMACMMCDTTYNDQIAMADSNKTSCEIAAKDEANRRCSAFEKLPVDALTGPFGPTALDILAARKVFRKICVDRELAGAGLHNEQGIWGINFSIGLPRLPLLHICGQRYNDVTLSAGEQRNACKSQYCN